MELVRVSVCLLYCVSRESPCWEQGGEEVVMDSLSEILSLRRTGRSNKDRGLLSPIGSVMKWDEIVQRSDGQFWENGSSRSRIIVVVPRKKPLPPPPPPPISVSVREIKEARKKERESHQKKFP